MYWKKMRYWLKGGLIGLVLAAIYNIVEIIKYNFDGRCYPVLTKSCNFYIDASMINSPLNIKEVLIYLAIDLTFLFIIGAIMGFVFGKIIQIKKSKNKKINRKSKRK